MQNIYAKKDFSSLKDMEGFSDQALETHFGLYEGYVNNTNKAIEILVKADKTSPEYAEVKRRLGWELNGVLMHELYFENLGGNSTLSEDGKLQKMMQKNFGGFDQWQEDFLATGKMRGIGWIVLYQDLRSGNLLNMWINEHDAGHPAGGNPLIVMDVFEHAHYIDYGKDRAAYVEAFMKNINWEIVEKRLQ